MSSVRNHELEHLLAHHFCAPQPAAENSYRTVPTLLRAVADWMDANDLQDPEFEGLSIRTQFPDSEDDHFKSATIYYREKK